MLQIILTLASARPDAFWFPNPLLPNDTALIAGSELDISSNVSICAIVNDVKSHHPVCGPAHIARVDKQSDASLQFVVPPNLPSGASYRVTLVPGGRHIWLNTPEVEWLAGDDGGAAVTAGGWLRVYGRGLTWSEHRCVPTSARTNASSTRLLLMRSDKCGTRQDCDESRVAPIKALLASCHELYFPIPGSLPPGAYTATIDNGLYLDRGSITALHLTVAPARSPGGGNVGGGVIGD